MRSLTALLFVALLLPTAQAALVGPQPYESSIPYAPGLRASADSFTFLSGQFEAKFDGASGPFGFFDAQETTLRGVQNICFTDGSAPPCRGSPSGNLVIRVAGGGAFAVDFPSDVDAVASADHALGLFVDFAGERDLQSLNLRQSLVASSIGGTTSFTGIPAIPVTGSSAAFNEASSGRWVGLTDGTVITVTDGSFSTTIPPGQPVLFQGTSLRVDTVHAETLVLPYELRATSTWTPAAPSAAVAGLELAKLNHVIDDLNDASKKGGADDSFNFEGLEPIQSIVARVLNGVLMRVPAGSGNSGDQPLKRLALIRLESVEALSDGSRIRLTGQSPLAIENGQVQGVQPLYGFSYLQLPWWSYVLWVLALAAFITRLAMGKRLPRPNQTRWHRLRWIGWITGPLAFILVFILWDFQTQATWGVSLFTAMGEGASPETLLPILGLQLGPFFLMLFAVVSPIALLARSGFRLGRQGAFMNLSGTIGYLGALVLGFPLLLSYLDYLIRQAVG